MSSNYVDFQVLLWEEGSITLSATGWMKNTAAVILPVVDSETKTLLEADAQVRAALTEKVFKVLSADGNAKLARRGHIVHHALPHCLG